MKDDNIEIDIKENSINCSFTTDGKFDDTLLENMADAFASLDRFKPVIVNFNGLIPVEAGMYCLEVSRHCTMIMNIEDEKAKEFLKFSQPFKDNSQLTINIKEK